MDGRDDTVVRAARPRRQIRDNPRLQILHVIEDYWYEHRRPPTIREICAAVKIDSTSHIAHHVSILKRQGLLRYEAGRRGLTPTTPTGLAVRGSIAAGEPLDLFGDDTPELLEFGELAMAAVPIRAGREIYALRVRGDSMIEDGILNGDYVLIAPGAKVANGAIAIATRNSANGGRGAATLKRVHIHPDGVRLQPANATLSARFIPAVEWDREWSVQGTVVAVYRRCES
jgi:repressor LexA